MKNFTVVPNELFEESQLSIPTRYLLCLLLKYCGQNETCYPSQKTLGRVMRMTDRHIRTLLTELEKAGLIYKRRTGFNKSNTYTVAKKYRKSGSDQLGSMFPLHQGSDVPTKSTYRKETSKRGSKRGMEHLRETMLNMGLPNPKNKSSFKTKTNLDKCS